MDFATPKRRRPAEAIVPMINVVFLLLIFFLMSAQIAPPDPFEVIVPDAKGATPTDASDTLFVDAQGQVYFDGAYGDDALGKIGARNATEPLLIRADRALPATILAALLPKLSAAGVSETLLLTGAP